MITPITQTLTVLELFPERIEYTAAILYSQAVADWLLDEQDWNGDAIAYRTELNVTITDIHDTASDIHDTVTAVLQGVADAQQDTVDAMLAEDAVAALQNFQGIWDSGTAYVIGESVSHLGVRYIAIAAGTNKNPVSQTSTWRSLYPLVGAIGNIMNPLLHIPLENSLVLEQGSGTVTFSRSTTGTYFDRYGVLVTAAIDGARFETAGLLIEGASTNLTIESNKPNLWPFSTLNPTANDYGDSPEGIQNSNLLHKSTGLDKSIGHAATGVNGVMAFSVFLKAGSLNSASISITEADDTIVSRAVVDLTTGAITNDVGMSPRAERLTNGWFRFIIHGVTTQADTRAYVYPGDYIDTTSGDIEMYGAQLEEQPCPTSYIPTTTVAITRAIDLCRVTLRDNLNERVGTIIMDAEYIPVTSTEARGFWAVTTIGGHRQRVELGTAGLRARVYFGDKSLSMSSVDYTLGNQRTDRLISVFSGTTLTTLINGIPRLDSRSMDLRGSEFDLVTNEIRLGQSYGTGVRALYGHIKNFRIYGQALTTAELMQI